MANSAKNEKVNYLGNNSYAVCWYESDWTLIFIIIIKNNNPYPLLAALYNMWTNSENYTL